MKKNERCLAILEILQKQHKVTVTELAEKFDISEMTVRRDLNSLAREYNISRTHGGAELGNQPVVRMISFDEPRIAHKDSKDKIAALAATMIQNGQRIFIDAGSTTRIILQRQGRIYTRRLISAVLESGFDLKAIPVIMLGGDMIRITNCSSGPVAEEQLKKYQLDTAFIGAAAIGSDGKLYDGYSPEARLKGTLFSVAKKIYVLADSSKMNTYNLNEFGSLSQIDGLITDAGIDEEAMTLMKRHRVNVIIAE